MAAVVEQKVILSGVSWETYERLLNDYYERHGAHFFYDDGELEIVVLSLRRERVIRDLATLVELAACELDIDFGHLGSTTFRSERLRKGFEPDSAFHFARVNDPDEDTPPDLVIDVEVSTPALNRFPICAGFGVPEVWRYKDGRVTFHRLEGAGYVEVPSSLTLPPLTAEATTAILRESSPMHGPEWMRHVSSWARQQR